MASKFRLIATENSEPFPICQEQNLSTKEQIQSPLSDRLPSSMPRRPTIKEVLARKMREAGGITPPEIARRAVSKGYSISPTAIKEMLRGATTNPSIFTLEAIAAGLNLAPAPFILELLGDKMEDANFRAGKFSVAAELFKSLTPTQQKKAEPYLEGLLIQLQHIKNQG